MAGQRKEYVEQMMSLIQKIRYTDVEREQELSLQLLKDAQEHKDVYAEVFAYTYLGDSYIAQNQIEQAGNVLKKAEKLLELDEFKKNSEQRDQLLVRITSLLGIYYEITSDEQSSIQYYLNALAVTRRINDTQTECTVLNNLAMEFQRHCCYDIAKKYLQEAYQLLGELAPSVVHTQIISNLVHMSVKMGDIASARRYCEECDRQEFDPAAKALWGRKNWCCYYAEVGEVDKARHLAGLILENVMEAGTQQFGVFEDLNILCDSMLKIEDPHYAKKYIEVLEESSIGTLEEQKLLEDKKLKYSILFEDEKKREEAYKRFYKKTMELKKQTNRTVASAMKDKIYLEEIRQQKENMQIEQHRLEKQVNVDELTEIYNRRYLEYLIQKYVVSENTGGRCGVIMLDVDYFKEYNDHYGHVKGDMVLSTIASCLKDNQTDGIVACRYGGDEFTCVCEDKTDGEIEAYIAAVREDLYRRDIVHEESKCSDRVTLSIGYANRVKSQRNGIHALQWMADKALYESKLSGRNTYRKK